jgi:hypothetical protein
VEKPMSEENTPELDPSRYLSAHGDPRPVPIEALLGDDPDLWLVTADMGAWSQAHPCECEALCTCDRAA